MHLLRGLVCDPVELGVARSKLLEVGRKWQTPNLDQPQVGLVLAVFWLYSGCVLDWTCWMCWMICLPLDASDASRAGGGQQQF